MEQEWDGERWNKESGGGEKITSKERERERYRATEIKKEMYR